MKRFSVSFAESASMDTAAGETEQNFADVQVPAGKNLSEDLTVKNSPVLFGCRTGICGTCVVEVIAGAEALPAPDEDELEILDLYADGQPAARLACQIDLQADITIRAQCKARWSGA